MDATYRAALAAAATSILEPTEQSWGDRVWCLVDSFDNRWWVATHLREFSETDHPSDYETDARRRPGRVQMV